MPRYRFLFGVLISFPFFPHDGFCSNFSKFPMIGFDRDGNPTPVLVSAEEYSAQVGNSISGVRDSLLTVLARRAHNGDSSPGAPAPQEEHRAQQKKWTLKKIVVGLGLKMKAGGGPLGGITVFPRFRMAFSKKD